MIASGPDFGHRVALRDLVRFSSMGPFRFPGSRAEAQLRPRSYLQFD